MLDQRASRNETRNTDRELTKRRRDQTRKMRGTDETERKEKGKEGKETTNETKPNETKPNETFIKRKKQTSHLSSHLQSHNNDG